MRFVVTRSRGYREGEMDESSLRVRTSNYQIKKYYKSNIRWIMEKAREFQKNIYFCFIDYARAFDCVDHNKLWNILKEMGIPDPDLPLEKSVCRSGSNS